MGVRLLDKKEAMRLLSMKESLLKKLEEKGEIKTVRAGEGVNAKTFYDVAGYLAQNEIDYKPYFNRLKGEEKTSDGKMVQRRACKVNTLRTANNI